MCCRWNTSDKGHSKGNYSHVCGLENIASRVYRLEEGHNIKNTSLYEHTEVPNPITVGPPNKGHFGGNNFVPCREVVPISEVIIAWCRNKCSL